MKRLAAPFSIEADQHGVAKAELDPTTPFTAHYTEDVVEDIREVQAERSSRAVKQDRRRNAKIPANFETWKDSPGRYDWPRVDTVPRPRLAERVNAVESELERRGKANIRVESAGERSLGEMEIDESEPVADVTIYRENHPSTPRVLSDAEAATRAHEAAHVVGERSESPPREQIFQSEVARREAGRLSERLEGAQVDVDHPSRDESEVFSEAGGAAILSPNIARREAPAFTERFDRALQDEVGLSLDDL